MVIVHGLWVHGLVMELLRRRVAGRGFRALTYSYPSMRLTLAENAGRLERYCRCLAAPRVHFVGHSLGGLLVLRMLERVTEFTPGRVVLTGTPYGGTFAGRRLARLPGGRAALGRSMQSWLNPMRLPPSTACEIGAIAGCVPLGIGRIVAPDLPAPSDGVVSVEETRVPSMRDHIVLNVNHSGMLISRAVAHQICVFLRDGAFEHRSA